MSCNWPQKNMHNIVFAVVKGMKTHSKALLGHFDGAVGLAKIVVCFLSA